MAFYPQYLEELREEARTILQSSNGEFTADSLQKLEKLDSFVRETARLEVTNAASFERKALKTFKLSDGTLIPAGTAIAVSSIQIGRDPVRYPDPDVFQGFRFVSNKASDPGRTQQFANMSSEQLTFGAGRHACPGRFFAGAIVKLLIAQFLISFEIKAPEDANDRYASISVASLVSSYFSFYANA